MTEAQTDHTAEVFINDAVTWFATRYQLRPEQVADQFRNVLAGKAQGAGRGPQTYRKCTRASGG